jgi:hypothetical protein
MQIITESRNAYRDLIDTEIELAHAIADAEQVQQMRNANAATKNHMWAIVRMLQAKIAELRPQAEAQLEASYAALEAATEAQITANGADAVETAEKIIRAAKKVSDLNAMCDREVTVWVYEPGNEYPVEWDGRKMTVAGAAREIGLRSERFRPIVKSTWEGYVSFIWTGRRVVVKGATAHELRLAYKIAA